MSPGLEGMPENIEEAPKMHWSKENLKDALSKLWELKEQPIFFGEDANSGKRGDEYYAMGYKVEKSEYEHFEKEVKKLLELGNMTIHEDLDKAA